MSLTWSDIRALIKSLPASSRFWGELTPEKAERDAEKRHQEEWFTPTNQLLMKVYDAVWASTFAARGVEEPVMAPLAEQVKATFGPTTGDGPDSKKPMTASEIRAEVAARRTRKVD